MFALLGNGRMSEFVSLSEDASGSPQSYFNKSTLAIASWPLDPYGTTSGLISSGYMYLVAKPNISTRQREDNVPVSSSSS